MDVSVAHGLRSLHFKVSKEFLLPKNLLTCFGSLGESSVTQNKGLDLVLSSIETWHDGGMPACEGELGRIENSRSFSVTE